MAPLTNLHDLVCNCCTTSRLLATLTFILNSCMTTHTQSVSPDERTAGTTSGVMHWSLCMCLRLWSGVHCYLPRHTLLLKSCEVSQWKNTASLPMMKTEVWFMWFVDGDVDENETRRAVGFVICITKGQQSSTNWQSRFPKGIQIISTFQSSDWDLRVKTVVLFLYFLWVMNGVCTNSLGFLRRIY